MNLLQEVPIGPWPLRYREEAVIASVSTGSALQRSDPTDARVRRQREPSRERPSRGPGPRWLDAGPPPLTRSAATPAWDGYRRRKSLLSSRLTVRGQGGRGDGPRRTPGGQAEVRRLIAIARTLVCATIATTSARAIRPRGPKRLLSATGSRVFSPLREQSPRRGQAARPRPGHP